MLKNITYVLKHKQFHIKDIFLLFAIVLSLGYFLMYTSYAIYFNTVDQGNVATIVAQTPTFTLTSTEPLFNNNTKQITVTANTKIYFDLKITNTSAMDFKYQIYYKPITPTTIDESVIVGLSTQSLNLNPDIVLSSSSNEYEKDVRIGIDNPTESAITIGFGVSYGYTYNSITLDTNQLAIGNIIESVLLRDKILADFSIISNTDSLDSNDSGLFVESGDNTKSINGLPTYYYKGNVTNNYVSFANMLWKVIRINEDGTIKLVLFDIPTEMIHVVYDTNTGNSNNFLESNAKLQLDNWYTTNIANDEALDGKVSLVDYCNDTTGTALTRLTNSNPVFVCPAGSNIINSKIGLVTADEFVYAGAHINSSANNSIITYLSRNINFWTLTSGSSNSMLAWNYASYYIDNWHVTSARGIRPVISLNADVRVTIGKGEQLSPWVIE